jgi:Zinc finger, C3HC4 type (RING finger)
MQSRHFLTKRVKKELRTACSAKLSDDKVFVTANDSICPICLEACNEISNIDCCRHAFCFSCISSWGKISPKCPLCKLSFKSATYLEALTNTEKIFRPVIEVSIDDELEEDILDLGDEDDAFSISHGYEMDGFVVSEESLDYDDYDDLTEADIILQRADSVILSRKRRKLLVCPVEVGLDNLSFSDESGWGSRGTSHGSIDLHVSSNGNHSYSDPLRSFESFLSSCELKSDE